MLVRRLAQSLSMTPGTKERSLMSSVEKIIANDPVDDSQQVWHTRLRDMEEFKLDQREIAREAFE